ncbi:Transcriptional antiterminator [Pilibacter termitis]|uniref:Ascorbate-specific PTS system EIIA component n=1 Tax=Pilibacter termitis TaxID=263852 RepID=A0A1T4Q6V5_9ENTE|nr:PTS sugar transporter subunit IIA [Pilibacter termitis]SJZ99261.1 Transcriptional antiterminator [Pilibacter termitis]
MTSQIINFLHSKETIALGELSETLGITRESLKNEVGKINEIARMIQISEIEIRGEELYLPYKFRKNWVYVKHGVNPYEIELSEEKRRAFIYLLVFVNMEPTSVALFQEFNRVSKNTTLADIKALREEIEEFGVQLEYSRKQGFLLVGSELAIRQLSYRYGTNLAAEKQFRAKMEAYISAFDPDFILRVVNGLEKVLKKTELRVIQNRYETVLCYLPFQLKRSQEHCVELSEQSKKTIEQLSSFQITRYFLQTLEFQLDEELYYLAILFTTFFEGTLTDTRLDFLLECGQQIIQELERFTAVRVRNREDFLIQLYNHLVPAFFRLRYGLQLKNEMTCEIKLQYDELFQLTKEIIQPLRRLLKGAEITDDELAFFTILFGGEIEAQSIEEIAHYRALVVCPNGMSSSMILSSELKKMFPTIQFMATSQISNISQFDPNSYEVIFTTFPIKAEKTIFHCKPIMTKKEKSSLIAKVNKELYLTSNVLPEAREILAELMPYIELKKGVSEEKLLKKLEKKFYQKSIYEEEFKPMLSELLTKDMIQFSDEQLDWEEAIELVATPLLETGKIETCYIQAMIDKVKELGAFIQLGEKFALPHARPEEGVNALGMSLLKLSQPTYLLGKKEHEVTLFICLAAIDNEAHLKALADLTKILSNKEKYQTLLNAKTKEEILEIIHEK